MSHSLFSLTRASLPDLLESILSDAAMRVSVLMRVVPKHTLPLRAGRRSVIEFSVFSLFRKMIVNIIIMWMWFLCSACKGTELLSNKDCLERSRGWLWLQSIVFCPLMKQIYYVRGLKSIGFFGQQHINPTWPSLPHLPLPVPSEKRGTVMACCSICCDCCTIRGQKHQKSRAACSAVGRKRVTLQRKDVARRRIL